VRTWNLTLFLLIWQRYTELNLIKN
jgi:hypothetical protein